MGCLAEDDLLALDHGGALVRAPALETHLADCATCSALVAAWLTDEAGEAPPAGWGSLVGRSLGPYRLDAQIGAGAMGAVYRGWDARLRRHVAVKVLTGIAGDATRARRLEVEARAAAAIAHPNVVAIHDVGVGDGGAYVVSELVDGDSLRSVIAAGPVPPARAVRLGLELARGLAAAHAAGVIHRDLKPDNVLVTADGVLKILDFGLAKRTDEPAVDVTVPGTVCGTAGYMAPEQARGEAIDARADLFAAGAILYELATGRRAFDGASHAERLVAVLRDEPVGLDRPALGALGPVIARCLIKDPARRFQSALDLAWVLAELDAADGARAVTTARSSPAATAAAPSRRGLLRGAAAAATAGVAGWMIGRRGRRPAPPAAGPTLRQLTFHQGRVMSARFARDGGGVFFGAAWEEQPLTASGLRLTGGVARALDLPSADVLAVSASALAIAIDRRHVDGQCATGRLALAPIDGGAPRVLADDVQEADFLPGGDALAVVTRAAGGSRLEAPLGRALLQVPGWLTHPRVSPDGGAIACLLHPDRNDDQGDVIVVDRATGAVRTVSGGWASVAGVAWSARGDRLWFTADRDGAGNALRSTTLDGRVRTELEALGRLRLHDVHGDRRVLVSREAWHLRTRFAADGEVERDRSLTPLSMAYDLSADGARLLVGELGDADEVNGVYVVPADGGPRLRLGPGSPRALSPDGQRVFAVDLQAVARGEPRGVVYPMAGGDRRPVALGPIARGGWAAWSDDRTLVVRGAAAGRPARMWRVPVDGGAITPLTTEGLFGIGAVHPATRRLAFVDVDDRLQVIDVDGGAAAAPRPGFRDRRVCGWTATGEVLLRTTYTPVDVARLDLVTGARTPHLRITPPALGLKAVDAVVLATGGAYAYSYGQELSELFLVDLA